MNKKLGIALSTISATALCLQPTLAFAKTSNYQIVENQNMKVILTAKDFYETFLCYQEFDIDQNVTYRLFEEVTEENADMFVAAKEFYNSLTPEFGEYYLIESDGIVVQSNHLKEDIDSLLISLQEEYEWFNFESMCEQAQAIVDARVVETEKKEEVKEEVEEDQKEEVKEDKKEETTTDKKESDKKYVEAVEVTKTGIADKLEIKAPFEPVQDGLLDVYQKPLTPVEEVVKTDEVQEVVDEKIDVEENVLKEAMFTAPSEMLDVEKVTVPIQPLTTTEKANNFISTYLTSAQGNIYAQANSLNAKNIINGLSAWNKLSSAEKNAVNTKLTNSIGKTYQTLLKEAQAVLYGTQTSTPTYGTPIYNSSYVNTATKTNAGFYTMLCAAMAGLVAFFTKKTKELK